jgi:hypothetical protein
VVVADDDAVGGPEAAAHLRLALFYLDEALACRATRLLGVAEGRGPDQTGRAALKVELGIWRQAEGA